MRKIALLLTAIPALAGAQSGSYPFCQILDRVDSPPWEVRVAYVADADVSGKNGDNVGIFRVNGGGGLAYFQTPAGDVDLTGTYGLNVFTGSGGIDLPDYLGNAAVNAAYTWRNSEGQAMRLTASPGIRSDLKDVTSDALSLPVEFLAIQAFSPDVSGEIGVAVFPWYEELFDPRFGIRWAPQEDLVIDLMYPESKLVFSPAEGWDLYTGVKADNTPEWAIDDNRERLLMDEMRAYIGVNQPVNGDIRMMYQTGYVFNREVDFKRKQGESDIENAVYVSVGVGGSL